MMEYPEFDEESILERLESLSVMELDRIPYGVVKMAPGGEVLGYNQYESELSGLSPDEVIGQDFFVQVAPCTNNFMVRERYNQGETLDAQLDYVFTYRMAPTKVKLRLLASVNHWFLLVKLPERTDA